MPWSAAITSIKPGDGTAIYNAGTASAVGTPPYGTWLSASALIPERSGAIAVIWDHGIFARDDVSGYHPPINPAVDQAKEARYDDSHRIAGA